MPVKNPSLSLLEAIRLDGACKETGVRSEWGYKAGGQAELFLLERNEKLPKGWHFTPAAAEKAKAE